MVDRDYWNDGQDVIVLTPVSLYTSDAADDMQCVDLGGRRIIKKNIKKWNRKKNKRNYF